MLAAVLVLSACTRGTTVEGDWAEGAPRNLEFTHLVVVGVTPNYNTRCRFERAMQASLKSPGVEVTTSCSRMTSKDPLTREAIVALVAETGADGVLATRLVGGRAGLEEGRTREARGRNYYKPEGYGYAYDPYFGAYGVPVVYGEFVAEAPELTLNRTAVIASNLYETRNATVVYVLDTTARNEDSPFAVIDEVTTAIATRLRKDGLVP